MNQANISYTRNHLSELIARVREGETIVILDRQQPVARLEPVTGPVAQQEAWQMDLVRRGLIRPARVAVDLKALRSLPQPKPRGDVLEALRAERGEGR